MSICLTADMHGLYTCHYRVTSKGFNTLYARSDLFTARIASENSPTWRRGQEIGRKLAVWEPVRVRRQGSLVHHTFPSKLDHMGVYIMWENTNSSIQTLFKTAQEKPVMQCSPVQQQLKLLSQHSKTFVGLKLVADWTLSVQSLPALPCAWLGDSLTSPKTLRLRKLEIARKCNCKCGK